MAILAETVQHVFILVLAHSMAIVILEIHETHQSRKARRSTVEETRKRYRS